MSDEDTAKYELIRRLSIQRPNDLRRIKVIEEDVRQIAVVERILWERCISGREPLDEKRLREAIAPVSQYFNTEAVVGLAKESESLEKRVSDADQKLVDILGSDIVL